MHRSWGRLRTRSRVTWARRRVYFLLFPSIPFVLPAVVVAIFVQWAGERIEEGAQTFGRWCRSGREYEESLKPEPRRWDHWGSDEDDYGVRK